MTIIVSTIIDDTNVPSIIISNVVKNFLHIISDICIMRNIVCVHIISKLCPPHMTQIFCIIRLKDIMYFDIAITDIVPVMAKK